MDNQSTVVATLPRITVLEVVGYRLCIRWRVLDAHWHHAFPAPLLNSLILEKVRIHQRLPVVSDHHPAPKLFPGKTSHSRHVVLNGRLHSSLSHSTAWMPSHPITSKFSTLLSTFANSHSSASGVQDQIRSSTDGKPTAVTPHALENYVWMAYQVLHPSNPTNLQTFRSSL